ncbi:Regulator of nonsense transcripts-like protein [Heracleum sosnowskyi]|uniref:Regulator of nonsense transcripts-like protein n=2 Tax=Heracleum sosnowskyi TaxID=360622 RepID=A0AAD8JEU4_9APIA|nr:Regulator of nonsense transcripts-like protein [Heracleum sosnowskyi]
MMGSSRADVVKKAEPKYRSLVDVVFSWTLRDALNKDLYKGKVDKIPTTFFSAAEYKKSFLNPLIEETHADLLSNIMKVTHAPVFEILDIKLSIRFKPPKNLYYQILVKRIGRRYKNEENDELQICDLIALTDIRPRYVADLNRPNFPYTIASVEGKTIEDEVTYFTILSSNPILLEDIMGERARKRMKLFSVHLTNLNTNTRIWNALNWEGANINIIQNLLQRDSSSGSNCSVCNLEDINSSILTKYGDTIGSFKLDDSQKASVLNCIATSTCFHHHSVKLLWGPPGTGKTKTVASLLFMLLGMKCRTLTCAPTNIAVVGVANRLMSSVREVSMYDTYGLGDIVLYGNEVKMKIDDHEDLLDIFLTNRVSCYQSFLSPFTGWRSGVESMICLIEDPMKQYTIYLNRLDRKDEYLPPHKPVSDSGKEECDDDNNATGMQEEHGKHSPHPCDLASRF